MVTANHIVIPVIVKGSSVLTYYGPRALTTSCVGASVKFIFGDLWQDALPHRTAIFLADPAPISVPITENSAIIPPECYIPFAPLRVCVCGTDCIPDDSAIARDKEICARMNKIYSEIPNCTGADLFSLLDEMKALENEQSALNLIRKRLTTDLCNVATVKPGVQLP